MENDEHRELRTARLTLRLVRLDDAPAIFGNYAADPEVTRYLQWQPQHDVEGVCGFLRQCEAQHEAGSAFNWVIRESQDAIGMISLRLESTTRAELGYVLAKSCWGRGYMPEVARAVIALGLGALGRFRVYAYTDFENARSARVLEKAGMQYEGRLRRYAVHPNLEPDPRDALMFAACR